MPGFDFNTGNGFIQADRALLNVANPSPVIYQLALLDSTKIPGIDTVTIVITGDYLTDATFVFLRGDTLNVNYISDQEVQATILPFSGNPAITAYNDPITSSQLDGGYSDSIYFTDPIKKHVLVVTDNKSRHYSESNPAFSVTVLVDSIPFNVAGYTLADLGLDSLNYYTPATSTSNVGFYLLRASRDSFDLNDPFEVGLTELFTYEYLDGFIEVTPMPMIITANDTTLTYGDKLSNFGFTYSISPLVLVMTIVTGLCSTAWDN